MRDLFVDYPEATCIIYREGEVIYTSEYKGVKPLMEFIRIHGKSTTPLIVVDRIMGRGAVLLAYKIGAKKIITPIMSEAALDLAKSYGLDYEAGKIVPYIINRSGDGRCPIESAVLHIEDIEEGYEQIKLTIAQLMSQ